MMVTAKAQEKEWDGAKSAKFTTGKRHMPAPQAKPGPHPLFNMGGRTHYEEKRSKEWAFKPTKTVLVPIDHEVEK